MVTVGTSEFSLPVLYFCHFYLLTRAMKAGKAVRPPFFFFIFPEYVVTVLTGIKYSRRGVLHKVGAGNGIFCVLSPPVSQAVDLHSWPENWCELCWPVVTFFEYFHQQPHPYKTPGNPLTGRKSPKPPKTRGTQYQILLRNRYHR